MVEDLNFFKRKPGHFIAFVAPLLKPLMLTKGEYIFNKDDPTDAGKFLISVFNLKFSIFLKKGSSRACS